MNKKFVYQVGNNKKVIIYCVAAITVIVYFVGMYIKWGGENFVS